ncbi:unnamed protein product, partial [Meganyctiphanes norvegica]
SPVSMKYLFCTIIFNSLIVNADLDSDIMEKAFTSTKKELQHLLELLRSDMPKISGVLLLLTTMQQWLKVQLLLELHHNYDVTTLNSVMKELADGGQSVILQLILENHNASFETMD